MPVVLGDLLEEAARSHPEGLAVVDGGRQLTYATLHERASRLARHLVQLGIGRGDRVGLFLEKSADAVIAVHGALLAGAAYVPMDPNAPLERVAFIARNCGLRCVLTSGTKRAAWAELVQLAPDIEQLVVVDDPTPDAVGISAAVSGSEHIDAQPAGPLDVPVIDQDLAYVLYTSGSTGQPKGVTLTHRNALAFVNWAADEFGVGPSDRLSSHAPFHFDLSIFDLFAAAHGAACLVLVPHRTSVFPLDVAAFWRDQRITVWYSVPSILAAVAAHGAVAPGDAPDLRVVLFAGEVFPTRFLRSIMASLPGARFANLYGPTETNVCTWYEVPPLPDDLTEAIPIGRPIPNDEVFVVTEEGRRAAVGEVGELYVRGATVMRGYWGDPQRTASSLVPDPFSPAFPDLVYRTGDLVRQDPDGNLRYLGRRDNQIKSRGYRIELGEVEVALNAHPEVRECAVVAIPDELITNRIKAFVVGDAQERELVKFCRQRLPKYMIPHSFAFLDSLPRTSTGKADRQALINEER